MMIYIAAPYSTQAGKGVDKIKSLALECYKAGHDVFCPYLFPEELWVRSAMEPLRRSDMLLLMDSTDRERWDVEYAEKVGMPVYELIPPMHPTELERPLQVAAFIEMVMGMYRLHLSKNADYSPANILGTGEIGVVVRLWDKVARLLNLTGFKLNVSASEFDRPKEPLNEAIEDTLIDAANYAVIAKLLRDGKWGR